MMRKWTIWILLILCSCETQVDIPIPYGGDKIVINSFIQPDSLVYIRITRSQPPGASYFPEIPGASVKLKAGDTEMPLDWKIIGGRGYFVSREPAAATARFHITAASAGLDTAFAADTLPRKPSITTSFAQAGGNRVKFQLKDLPGHDYYRFRLYRADEHFVPVAREQYRFDPSYNNSFTDLVTDRFIESSLITDERFDGQQITVVMQTEHVLNANEFLLLEVTGLTYDAYQYLKTLELQATAEDNLLVDMDKVHTNVKGGFGIVGGVYNAYLQVPVK